MKRFFFALLLLPIYLTAQNHDYHWTLGYGGSPSGDTIEVFGGINIDFNVSPPLPYKVNRNLNFGLNAACCSDSSGNLIFFTNGIRIFNKTNTLMENGDTINPGHVWESTKFNGYASPVGGLSIPRPGYNNQYYLFHLSISLIDSDFFFSPLYYTLIDMNENGGLGKVIEKNKIVWDVGKSNIIWPSITKHANGRDWWLLVAEVNSPYFYRYLISPSGIEGPWIQLTEIEFEKNEGPSTCLFSPDGSKYLRCDASNGISLFTFNRCTGELSNHQFLPRIQDFFLANGSAIFSPDSKKLHVSDNRTIVIQFDLDSDGILSYSRMDTIQQFDLFADPGPPFSAVYFFGQLGADNKLYRATGSSPSYIHVVHRPNLPAPVCDLENHGFDLPRFNASTVCYFPNYRLGVWEGSPCDTIQLQNPPPGFVKTSYEAFLEREARFKAQKQESSTELLEHLKLQSTLQEENENPFNPTNLKHVTLRALAEQGIITEEDALILMQEN